MSSTVRGVAMAGAALLLGAGTLWAHPGHLTEGGAWHTVTHTLSSSYHVAVVCAVVVLAVAGALFTGPARHVQRKEREANELR